jgi:hypothetical protein
MGPGGIHGSRGNSLPYDEIAEAKKALEELGHGEKQRKLRFYIFYLIYCWYQLLFG